MSFELLPLSVIILVCWLGGASRLGLLMAVIPGLILFSSSTPLNILLLLSLTLISAMVAFYRGEMAESGITQKLFALRMGGLLLALFGSIAHPPLMLVGLILSLPIFIGSTFFNRHYLSLKSEDYLISTVLPALATLLVLDRIKPLVKADYQQFWDLTLSIVGLGTLMISSLLVFVQRKTRPFLVHYTQALIGLSLFLLIVETNLTVECAQAAILCAIFSGPLLLLSANQISRRAQVYAKVLIAGMPGLLGFSGYYYSFKALTTLNPHWVWVVLIAVTLLVLGVLVVSFENTESEVSVKNRAKLRFGVLVFVQLICSVGIFFIERGFSL